MLSSKDMGENDFDYSNAKRISEEDYRQLVRNDCKPLINDILIIKDGNSYLKSIFLCKEEREQAILSSIAIVRPNPELVLPEYLTYYLKSSRVKDEMALFLSGAAIPRIIIDDFKKVKVKLPAHKIQLRIAEILGRYDELIENYNRQIVILESTAQNIYREWFVRGRCPRAVYEEGTDLPVGWKMISLYDLVDTQYGFTASATDENTGVKFLRITDISGNSLNWADVPFCQVSENDAKKYELKAHDIVVARIGATAGHAKRINKNHPKSVFASYLVRMQVRDYLHRYFIGMTVESDYFRDFIDQAVGGAAQPQANVPVLTSFETVFPSDSVLEKFNLLVEPIFDKLENLQIQIAKLRQVRDRLLPRLLSGKLPASGKEI
jgi:type I restriction enzyme S subunit